MPVPANRPTSGVRSAAPDAGVRTPSTVTPSERASLSRSPRFMAASGRLTTPLVASRVSGTPAPSSRKVSSEAAAESIG